MPPAPKPCGMVSAAPEARQVPHVRTLSDHILAGSVPAAVRLSRTAELSAALQRGADAADPDRARRGRATPIRAGALGPDPALGQGSAQVHAADQRARRIGERQAGVPLCHAAAPLPGSCRRLLRVEGRGRTQAPLSACGRRTAGRSPSPDCGRPGSGRTARKWRPPPSSRPTPAGTSLSCTIACRWSCRPARSICGSIAATSMPRPRARCWLPPPKDCSTPTRFRPRSIARRTTGRRLIAPVSSQQEVPSAGRRRGPRAGEAREEAEEGRAAVVAVLKASLLRAAT